jgi:SAM-dependent methyltransferase
MDSNAKTLATYDDNFSNYIEGTVQITSGFQKQWLEYVLGQRKKDARILEVGAGFGRDAAFILEQGYTQLTVTDAFDAAVATLLKRGFFAKKLNLLLDDIDEDCDLIIAAAVFLHFTEDELRRVFMKLKDALAEGGILAFSVKQGVGEEWTNAKMDAPRFFRYWSEADMRGMLGACGYSVVDMRHTQDGKWMHVTCTPLV